MATALGALAGDFFFLKADAVNLALFVVVGVAISLVCGQLRASRTESRNEAERLRLISDSVPQFLWTAQPDGNCNFANRRFLEYTGAPPEQIFGSGWSNFVHPDDLPATSRWWTDLTSAGRAGAMDFRLRRHDGVYRWFKTRAAPRLDRKGNLVQWFGSHSDIQESHEIRDAILAEQERFSRIVAAAPSVICKFTLRRDGSMSVPFASPAIADILGIAPSEVAIDATPLFACIHPNDIDRVRKSVAESARTLSLWHEEFRVQHPSKGELWVSVKSAPVRQAEGVTNWYGFLSDITDAKCSMLQRAEHEVKLLRTLVERSPMGIVVLDRRLCYVAASGRWLDEVGLTRESALGRSHYECFPNLPGHWKVNYARGLAGETISGRGEPFETSDGHTRWVNWQIAPWGDAGEATGGIVIYSEDITERELAVASARKHEMQYRALFENMTQGLAYCQMIFEDGVGSYFLYLAVNPHFETLTGLKNVVGKRITELVPQIRTLDPGIFELCARVAQTGSAERVEWFVKSMGQWYSVSVYSPEKGFFVAIFDDITQRKQAETVARQWQHAFERSEIGISLTDPRTNTLVAVNAAFARRLGYTPRELAGYPVVKLISPDEFPRVMAELGRAQAGDGHAVFETLHVRKDGSHLPVSMDSTLLREEEGRSASRVSFSQDLTETRKTQADLREREHTVSALLDSAAQAILAVNEEGRIVFLNRMAGRLFGFRADELIGQALDILLPREAVAVPNGTALKGTHRDGSGFPVEIHLSFIDSQQGTLTIAFVNDITERILAEEQIKELNRQLELRVKERTVQLEIANRELESFSYSVSHDLRAPLRGIDGWSLALLEDYGSQLDERAGKYLSRVRSETQRMGELIDDLLRLSRVNRGEMQRTQVDLTFIAMRVAAKLREAHRGRILEFSIARNLTARGDARLLEIVLTNLLDNAVKFTGTRPQARIEFGEILREGKAAFYVRDNGVGFEMRHASTLFGAFQRLHKVSEFPGTGIGLATVKRAIHRHGGEVWSESEVDRGATLGFTLPPENARETNHA